MIKKISEKYRKNLSIACSGEKNGMYGKKHTDSTKEKIRNKLLLRCQNPEYLLKLSTSAIIAARNRWKNPVYKAKQSAAISKGLKNYIRTPEHQCNVDLAKIGRIPWNKGFGKYMVGSKNPMFGTRGGMYQKQHSAKTKLKMRNSTLAYIEKQHGRVSPRVGKHEKELLDATEKKLGFSIDRTVRIGGFFPDGYCHELNLIIEVDEKPKTSKKEVEREEYLKKKLGCEFMRIKDYCLADPSEPTSSGDRVSEDSQKVGTQWSSQK